MEGKQRESSDKMADEIDLGNTDGLLVQGNESRDKFAGNENQVSNLKRIVLLLGVVFLALMLAGFIALARRDLSATSAHRNQSC